LDGVRSVITLIPELKLGIAVLANLNLTPFPELIRAKFLESYIGEFDNDLTETIKQYVPKLLGLVTPPQRTKDAQAYSLDKYTGIYQSELYGDFKIERKDKGLIVLAGPAKYAGKLTPWSNNTFILTWPAIDAGFQEVTFNFDANGNPYSVQTTTLGTWQAKK
jgi:hypothetical protein